MTGPPGPDARAGQAHPRRGIPAVAVDASLRGMSRRFLIALAAALTVGAGGCASSGSGSSAASSTTASSAAASSGAAVCQPADDLRTSVTALQQVDVVKQGTVAVQQAFDQVKTDLTDVADAAGAQLTTKVAPVQADAAAVQVAVDAAKAAPNAQTLGALGAAVRKLVQDAQTLLTSVGSSC